MTKYRKLPEPIVNATPTLTGEDARRFVGRVESAPPVGRVPTPKLDKLLQKLRGGNMLQTKNTIGTVEEFEDLMDKAGVNTFVQFNDILKDTMDRLESLQQAKGEEYSGGRSNRYHNFFVAAKMDNETPERALWGMAKKHLVSILDILRQIDTQGFELEGIPTSKVIAEKIGDMILYLILLRGIIELRRQVLCNEKSDGRNNEGKGYTAVVCPDCQGVRSACSSCQSCHGTGIVLAEKNA